MKSLSDFSAVIFDLDGLVLDTESTYIIAWQRAVEKMGYDFSTLSMSKLSGLHYDALIKLFFSHFGAKFDLNHFNSLSAKYWHDDVQQYGIARKSGFDELLTLIKECNLPFCLATNSAKINAQECLILAGLAGTFSLIISRDDVKQGKPAPDIFLQAAKCLQQPIQQCLVLEDSWIGIKAAQAAGAIPILIPSFEVNLESMRGEKVGIFSDLKHVAEMIRTQCKVNIA
jgi:HAD superfamily hydrolase (TIGR01509 family)